MKSPPMKRLPAFAKPPVVEVSLGLQFEALSGFRSVHAGLFWGIEEIRNSFPIAEEHVPLDPVVEKPGPAVPPEAQVRMEVKNTPPLPRFIFFEPGKEELIQLQENRFAHNWRKAGPTDEYPRYSHMRPTLERELRIFERFIAGEKLGELRLTQGEITYVNHIEADAGGGAHRNPGEIFSIFPGTISPVASLESLRFESRHEIVDHRGLFSGRLHIALRPALRATDKKPIYVVQLIARGAPRGEGIEGAFSFLDDGHERVVEAFADITTAEMHRSWERFDGP